ncbi:S1 RNA-binding domain-containing protein [Streptococcus pneumoniae]|nr:S1 RNA-binding domain-containing protein [Streptococcus pneumoniae]
MILSKISSNHVSFRKSLQTTSASNHVAPSATSKQYFEQPVASFLVCALIFIEYKGKYSELK